MGYCPGQTAEIFYPNQRVIQLNMDACKFLKDETLPLFDVVICDLPDPVLGVVEGLYSPQFWKDMYTRMAPDCVVATHCGPIAPASVDGITLASSVSDTMVEAGFTGPRLGKVAIPSYQSEWGFLFGIKTVNPTPYDMEMGILPEGCRILDADALSSFFRIPAYYSRVE